MGDTYYYVRKEKILIGNSNADICIPDMEKEYLVTEKEIYVRGEKEKEVAIHKIEIGENILDTGDFRIIIYDEMIAVEGDHSKYACKLQPVSYKEVPFEGFPYYKRSPRIHVKVNPETIKIKNPPQKAALAKGSLMQVMIPPLVMLAVTIFMSVYLKRGLYVIASICTTIVTIIFSVQKFFSQRKEIRQKNETRERVYMEYLVKERARIRALRKKEKDAIEYQTPDAEQIEAMMLHYDSRLYEKSMGEEDFLEICLGYKNGQSGIRVQCGSDELNMEEDALRDEAESLKEEFGSVHHMPVMVNLYKNHLGIVGEEKNIHNQLKYLLLQICFFHSYHDVQIIFIGKEKSSSEFSYLRWYPHLRIQSINVVAEIFNQITRDQILGSVLQMVKDRKQRVEESNKGERFCPQLLFIIDEPQLIQDHAIMEYLEGSSGELGISIIYTTDQRAKLPENIQTVCILENSETGRVMLREGIRCNEPFEIVSMKERNVERVSRKCAAVIHEKGMVSRIPESITFFEMYQIQHPEELNVQSRWKNHAAHKSLAVPLGVREQNNYVELNLHEKAHGPHGLVAGTTGSGKSEIVQSYILSLAVNFHPYEVGFLLIDYKGGGMANLFKNLPHLLGTITNLDGAESHRAMVSIKSELARRQRVFNEYGVNHINGYHKLYQLGKAREPIPHLFLISDEFAELKKEQPEFMKELVSTARIGRSLGIHLILATQKPSGVVDDQIWTNSKFKLCLKVQNEADSREMLKTPDAASIVQPGRAYLQVGNNEIYELFQSAFSGASYHDEQEREEGDQRVYLVNRIGQGQLINQDLGGSLESNRIHKTQLDVVVGYVKNEFLKTKLPKVKSPWLPPLQPVMVSPLFERITDSAIHKELNLNIPVGIEDIPEEQKQIEYQIQFLKQGHVIFFASSGYGKTVFLETLLLGLCALNSVKNLHAYLLDFGNNALLPLKALPHVADYITYDNLEKQQKLMALLFKEMKQRKQLMADAMAQNFEIYNQMAEQPLPAIVLFIDNYDVVKELEMDENFFVQLARDGVNLGIYLAITASRSSVVKYALMNQIKTKIAGYNYEPAEPRNIVGRSEYVLPEIKGRVLVKDENVNMMQIYTPVPYSSGLEYNQNLQELIGKIAGSSTEEKAVGIPVLPEQFRVGMLKNYGAAEPADVYLGLEKQRVYRIGIQTTDTPFLIIGPVRSGKSNTVRMMLQQMLHFERIYVFDAKTYELQDMQKYENVMYVDNPDKLDRCKEELMDLTEERREDCQAERGNRTVTQFYGSLEKYAVVINELSDFVQFINDDKNMIQVLGNAADTGILVILTGHSAHMPVRNETAKLVEKAENGLLLGDPGINSPFPTFRGKELPDCVEDGLLYQKGSSTMIRIPKA